MTAKKVKVTRYEELDRLLLLWFTEYHSKNLPISGPMLQEQANIIASSLRIPNFVCSSSWVTRVRKRNSIVAGTVSGKSNAVNMQIVCNWLETQWPIIREGYEDQDIFNADETALFYKCLPNKTLKFKGETCHGGKL